MDVVDRVWVDVLLIRTMACGDECVNNVFVANFRPAVLGLFERNVGVEVNATRGQVRAGCVSGEVNGGCVRFGVFVDGSVAGASNGDEVDEAFVFWRARLLVLLGVRDKGYSLAVLVSGDEGAIFYRSNGECERGYPCEVAFPSRSVS